MLANPGTVLAYAVAALVDRHDRIPVDGLRPPPPDAAMRRVLADVCVGAGPDYLVPDDGWGEAGFSVAEKLFAWITIEVLAFGAGTPQRPVNAVPHEALVHGTARPTARRVRAWPTHCMSRMGTVCIHRPTGCSGVG